MQHGVWLQQHQHRTPGRAKARRLPQYLLRLDDVRVRVRREQAVQHSVLVRLWHAKHQQRRDDDGGKHGERQHRAAPAKHL